MHSKHTHSLQWCTTDCYSWARSFLQLACPILQATAERLGLMHLLDKRFGGMAKGVGTGKILGRIHQVADVEPWCDKSWMLH